VNNSDDEIMVRRGLEADAPSEINIESWKDIRIS